jgi:hypothetical protein
MSTGDRDVLTSLPRSRSTRRSAKRGGGPAGTPEPTAETKPAAAKPKAKSAAPKRKPAAKTTAKAKTTTAKPKTAPKRKPAAKTTAKAEAAAPPPPPPAGWAAPKADAASERPGGGELIGTAVQAVGELAQIGLTFGGQALKQALSRFPRP